MYTVEVIRHKRNIRSGKAYWYVTYNVQCCFSFTAIAHSIKALAKVLVSFCECTSESMSAALLLEDVWLNAPEWISSWYPAQSQVTMQCAPPSKFLPCGDGNFEHWTSSKYTWMLHSQRIYEWRLPYDSNIKALNAIYGLKQSSLEWYMELRKAIFNDGEVQRGNNRLQKRYKGRNLSVPGKGNVVGICHEGSNLPVLYIAVVHAFNLPFPPIKDSLRNSIYHSNVDCLGTNLDQARYSPRVSLVQGWIYRPGKRTNKKWTAADCSTYRFYVPPEICLLSRC